MKCRIILVLHRQPDSQPCYVDSTLRDQCLQELHLLVRLRPLQRTVRHIAFQHTAGTICIV
ncbi:hypothetical protein [Gemmiger formicilis]|uniref:hypothetical protein n=1 Tax=Gemmiger formicilis TaxID=745368 RepID=UPI0020982892|nr:hypothetical protein [Gemmiger formicilis]MCO7110403.1 hypothetical protein [Gemmiger formicilis]